MPHAQRYPVAAARQVGCCDTRAHSLARRQLQADQRVVAGVRDRGDRSIRSSLGKVEPLRSQNHPHGGALNWHDAIEGLRLDRAECAVKSTIDPAPDQFDGVTDKPSHPAADRMLIDLGWCSPLQNPTVSHHRDVVSQRESLLLIVRDEQTRALLIA